MTSPAPLNPLASDGRPGTLSADAGGAKMHVRQTHAWRAASGRVSHAKSAQAVTLFTMGRSARSGRGPVPANRRATPMVVGARARRPFPIRWWQNLAAAKVALKDVGKTRTRLFPSVTPPADGAGPEAAQFLLRDNLRAFFPINAGNRILPQPAHVRQDPPGCMSDVFQSFALRFILHKVHRGPGDTVEAAMHRAERLYGVPASWLHRLRYRDIKDLPTSAFFAIVNAYNAAAEAGERAYAAERELADARNSKVVGLADLVAGPEDERTVK